MYMLQYIMLGFTVVFQGVAKGENREGLFVLLCGSGPGAAFIYGYNNKEEISNGCLRLFYRVPALESVPMAAQMASPNLTLVNNCLVCFLPSILDSGRQAMPCDGSGGSYVGREAGRGGTNARSGGRHSTKNTLK